MILLAEAPATAEEQAILDRLPEVNVEGSSPANLFKGLTL
jgi:hypothetical protein